MTFAKKAIGMLLVVALLGPVVGCGVGTTAADNRRIVARTFDYDARELVDDTMLLLQINRPLRTSHVVID